MITQQDWRLSADEELRAAAHAVPGTRTIPGVITALGGPELAEPEVAGALTLLHTTFADNGEPSMATANFAAINEDFCDWGVLRWLTFNDGPHGYALGLWGTTDEVAGFIAGSATPEGVLPTVQHRHGGPRPCV